MQVLLEQLGLIPAGSPAARRCAHVSAGRWKYQGFSLIELLVVIAITAILVAIIAPSLSRARAGAMMVRCQHQLKQWGTAFEMYATANEGFYPHADGLDRDKDWTDHFGWVDVLPPLMGSKPWRDHPPYSRPDAGTIFQCPAARLAGEAAYAYRPKRDGYFSYAMNSCLELDENCWPADGGSEPMPSFLKTDRIVKPYRVVLLFEQLLRPSLGYGGQARYPTAGKYCGSYPKAFSARHARSGESLGGSIMHCDYHVEFRSTVWKPDWPADLEVPPREDPEWFPYPP